MSHKVLLGGRHGEAKIDSLLNHILHFLPTRAWTLMSYAARCNLLLLLMFQVVNSEGATKERF